MKNEKIIKEAVRIADILFDTKENRFNSFILGKKHCLMIPVLAVESFWHCYNEAGDNEKWEKEGKYLIKELGKAEYLGNHVACIFDNFQKMQDFHRMLDCFIDYRTSETFEPGKHNSYELIELLKKVA